MPRSFPGNCFDSANARSHTAFRDELKKPYVPGKSRMRSSTKLPAKTSHLHHPYRFPVFFTKKGDRASLLGFLKRKGFHLYGCVFLNSLINQFFHPLKFPLWERRKRGNQRTFLMDMIAENLPEDRLKNVRGGMICRHCSSFPRVNNKFNPGSFSRFPFGYFNLMKDKFRKRTKRVEYFPCPPLAFHPAFVSRLPSAFPVKGGL